MKSLRGASGSLVTQFAELPARREHLSQVQQSRVEPPVAIPKPLAVRPEGAIARDQNVTMLFWV